MTQPPDTHITADAGHGHGSAEHGITAHPGHGHGGHGHGVPAAAFTPAEWNSFHHDDRTAGTAIVLEVGGIFVIGLILYTIVLLVVSASP
jgi:hypothetical protein